MPRFSKKANLVKELESVIQVRTLKAYLQFYLDAEDRFEDELDYYFPLRAFDDSLAQTLRALGDQTALQELGVEQETLNLMKQQVRDLVGPSFTRAQNKPSSHVGSEQTDALKRQNFNFNLYCDIRAYSQIKEKQGASRTEMRRFAKSFETAWGKNYEQVWHRLLPRRISECLYQCNFLIMNIRVFSTMTPTQC